MPSYRKTERRNADVLGIIDPRLLYDTDAVMEHAGIGEEKLLEERKAGRLQFYRGPGNRHWYRGEDLIALILGVDGKVSSKQEANGNGNGNGHG